MDKSQRATNDDKNTTPPTDKDDNDSSSSALRSVLDALTPPSSSSSVDVLRDQLSNWSVKLSRVYRKRDHELLVDEQTTIFVTKNNVRTPYIVRKYGTGGGTIPLSQLAATHLSYTTKSRVRRSDRLARRYAKPTRESRRPSEAGNDEHTTTENASLLDHLLGGNRRDIVPTLMAQPRTSRWLMYMVLLSHRIPPSYLLHLVDTQNPSAIEAEVEHAYDASRRERGSHFGELVVFTYDVDMRLDVDAVPQLEQMYADFIDVAARNCDLEFRRLPRSDQEQIDFPFVIESIKTATALY